MTGKLSKPDFIFERHKARQIDYGIDFYASQTMKHADGRRILVGWMHNWESNSTPENYLWNGMMTLPRELKVKNEILYQSPVKEMMKYRFVVKKAARLNMNSIFLENRIFIVTLI